MVSDVTQIASNCRPLADVPVTLFSCFALMRGGKPRLAPIPGAAWWQALQSHTLGPSSAQACKPGPSLSSKSSCWHASLQPCCWALCKLKTFAAPLGTSLIKFYHNFHMCIPWVWVCSSFICKLPIKQFSLILKPKLFERQELVCWGSDLQSF